MQSFCYPLPEHQAWLRGVRMALDEVTPELSIASELVQRSFRPGDANYLPPEVRSGPSLPQWLALGVQRAHRLLLAQQQSMRTHSTPPLLACNALHTNFVRGSGFVIQQQQLIAKPPQAIALDGHSFQGLAGRYTALVLAPGPAQVRNITITGGQLAAGENANLAISGPALIVDGRNCAADVPVRLAQHGQTLGDEINFSPTDPAARTSFTAIGLDRDGHLLLVSVFAGEPQRLPATWPGGPALTLFSPTPGSGLTLVELAAQLLHLGAWQAILGGGSGDTQQWLDGSLDDAGLYCALPRPQVGRPQVGESAEAQPHDAATGPLARLRGLGVILSLARRPTRDQPAT